MTLYSNPRGLYPFQAEATALCILRPNNICAMEAGLGKTHICLAAAAVLIEDDIIDRALLLVERNKVDDWASAIERFTTMTYDVYLGDRDRRVELLHAGGPQIILTTYNTAYKDLAVVPGPRRKVVEYGPLTERLRGQRLLLAMDEVAVLADRTGSWHRAVKAFDEQVRPRKLGLTGTPVTNSIESLYNLGRIFCPDQVGTVKSFENDHVQRRNNFGTVTVSKNEGLLHHKMSGVLIRKRKSDYDVRDQFPEKVESFSTVRLDPAHKALYDALEMLATEMETPAFKILQNFANDPSSILESDSVLAGAFIARHGADKIRQLHSTKLDVVARYVLDIVAQGDQVLVFEESPKVLRGLKAKLGIPVAEYHGEIDVADREKQLSEFRSGKRRVMLASAAGERGLDLPEATYIVNMDTPKLHSSYIQRIERGSRVGMSIGGTLVVKTFVAYKTVEDGAMRMWLRRNHQSDVTIDEEALDDDAFTTSKDRHEMLQDSRRRMRSGGTP